MKGKTSGALNVLWLQVPELTKERNLERNGEGMRTDQGTRSAKPSGGKVSGSGREGT